MTPLNDRDRALVREAEHFLGASYKENVHHAACLLTCGEKTYRGLHLDSNGFDVCAEDVALGTAMTDGKNSFETIVTVLKTPSGISVVNPCGDCRQLLIRHAPNVRVIVADGEKLYVTTPAALLPFPY